jgi:hypothetical protein
MSSFDISKVKRLRRHEPLNENNMENITLEGLKKMSFGYLDEENPATYELFLKYNLSLTVEEVAYYKNIIEILKENEIIKEELLKQKGLRKYEDYINDLS